MTQDKIGTHDVSIHIHPYTNSSALNKHGAAKVFEKGEGIYLFDENQNRYLDGVSGLWSVNLGYSCSRITRAISEQASRLPFGSTHTWLTNRPATLLISKLLKLSNNFFTSATLANSGSESIELANYTASKYWHSHGFKNKKKILCLEGGYHGSTLLTRTMSYHGSSKLREQFGVVSIPIPCSNGIKKIDETLVDSIEKKINEIGADKISFLIMETVQLRNGVNIPVENFFPLLENVLKKYKILLVLDESVTGIGRLGGWYGYQSFNSTPDMVVVSKGLSSGYQPISALLMGSQVHSTLSNNGAMFNAGFSTSGHPIACSSAIAALEEIEETSLLHQLTTKKIPLFKNLCESLFETEKVISVRSFGLLAAIDFGDAGQDFAKSIKNQCFKDKLIIRNSGSSIILCPPLITSHTEMESIFNILRRNIELKTN